MTGLVADVERSGRRTVYRDAVVAQVSGFRPLVLDLVVPVASQAVATVVYVHGGGFAGGTHKISRDSLGYEVTRLMTASGIAVASISYRLSGEARFPSQVHDVKAAVRWLRHHAAELGLDPARIAAWGASAGGYLVAMLATTAGHPDLDGQLGITAVESTAIAAGVSWYGPSELSTQPRLGPPEWTNTDPALSPESKLLGAAVETVPELAAYASPTTHVSPRAAPMLLVHGDRDQGVPLAQALALEAVYRRAGAAVDLLTIEGGSHGFRDTPIEPWLRHSARFLADHLNES